MSNEVIVLEKQAAPVISEASRIVITDADTLAQATTILSKVNQFLDRVQEEREKVTKPLNEALKAERARWKPLEETYTAASQSLRDKMTVYATEADRIAKIEEDRIAKRVAVGKGNLSPTTAAKKIAAIEKVDKTTTTDAGSITFVDTPCFEVTDIVALANFGGKYVTPNETLIRAEQKAGTALPGVRYWIEKRPRNNR